MYTALVVCRAGMGSSTLLKIRADQVINAEQMPIETEHGNLDSLMGFSGDVVITMADLAGEIKDEVPYVIGIQNIMDKEEMREGLTNFLSSKESKN